MEYKVVITVKDVKGYCSAGHKVGDVMEVEGLHITKGRICSSAMVAIYPRIFAMRFGAKIPWAKNGKILAGCPDPENTVIFEISRRRSQEVRHSIPKVHSKET